MVDGSALAVSQVAAWMSRSGRNWRWSRDRLQQRTAAGFPEHDRAGRIPGDRIHDVAGVDCCGDRPGPSGGLGAERVGLVGTRRASPDGLIKQIADHDYINGGIHDVRDTILALLDYSLITASTIDTNPDTNPNGAPAFDVVDVHRIVQERHRDSPRRQPMRPPVPPTPSTACSRSGRTIGQRDLRRARPACDCLLRSS